MERRQVLFIHGAGDKRDPEGSGGLIAHLEAALGSDYEVLSPDMPDPENPRYAAWKSQIESELADLDDDAVLIGHSVGGSVLLKCLSEGIHPKPVSGLFLIAAPYWGKDDDWHISELMLPEDFASRLPRIARLFLYHSRDDESVPFAHLAHYQAKLPGATARVLDGAEHAFVHGLRELEADIRAV
jgi:predicted alpha/beta hydrolase family esterase